ncbi:putative porin, partial [bacterium]|nr:putative porin [bacterium]
GQWQVAYQYKHLEADAAWDAITDSDFGLGGTDRQGHSIKLAYQLQDWWQLGFNVLLTEKISRRPNTGHNVVGNRGEDLLRLQADSLFRF